MNVGREKQPCLVQMKASWADAGAHYVALTFTNASAHGVYLESIAIVDPKNVALDVAPAPHADMQFGSHKETSWVAPDQLLPYRLPPIAAESRTIVCRMQDGDDGGRRRASLTFRGAVTLEYKCSQLDQPKPVVKRIAVQLREKGPAGL